MKLSFKISGGTNVPMVYSFKVRVNIDGIELFLPHIFQHSVNNAISAAWMWINLKLLPTPYIL